MRKIILIVTYLYWFTPAHCQHIHYQNTLNKALKQAAKSKKPVFINLSSPPIPNHSLKLALTDPEIVKLYNKNFVNYTISLTDSAAAPLIKKYKTTLYPAYLFIDTLGNLIYKETSGSTSAYKYINMSKKVLEAQATGRTLTNYIARYNMNRNDPAFLKDYITLREELGYEDNADLVDQYADHLTLKDFQDYKTVLFILKAGPIAYGRAYTLCYINKPLIDSFYKTEPLELRTLINNRIITNTINDAIANKNAVTAQQAARFTAATWSANKIRGEVSSTLRMLTYYSSVGDTALYYIQASLFYNKYYMNISADSAARVDKEIANNRSALAVKYPVNPNNALSNAELVNELANSGPNRVANTLNHAAYLFYSLGTHNQTYLVTAMLWSKRAIELYPYYGNYSTLAHLLYRLNLFEEAKSTQDKALELALKNKAGSNWIVYLKTEQRKIKEHTLK